VHAVGGALRGIADAFRSMVEVDGEAARRRREQRRLETRKVLLTRSRLLVRSHVRVPLSESEFVDWCADMCCHEGDDDVARRLEVFYLLTSLKESAGV